MIKKLALSVLIKAAEKQIYMAQRRSMAGHCSLPTAIYYALYANDSYTYAEWNVTICSALSYFVYQRLWQSADAVPTLSADDLATMATFHTRSHIRDLCTMKAPLKCLLFHVRWYSAQKEKKAIQGNGVGVWYLVMWDWSDISPVHIMHVTACVFQGHSNFSTQILEWIEICHENNKHAWIQIQ